MLNPLAPISGWHGVFRCATGLGLALMSAACFAAPEEIQVYLDDLTEPGRFGTDLHNNFVISGYSSSIPNLRTRRMPVLSLELKPTMSLDRCAIWDTSTSSAKRSTM